MEFNTEIVCTDKNGVPNLFKYSMDESKENGKVQWTFSIMPFDLNANDWFEFAITLIDDKVGKVTVMTNRNLDIYRGKGIPEKMIEEAAKVLGFKIISSTNKDDKKSLSTESRSTAADKIWERLTQLGYRALTSTC